jgi:hypothetical protein
LLTSVSPFLSHQYSSTVYGSFLVRSSRDFGRRVLRNPAPFIVERFPTGLRFHERRYQTTTIECFTKHFARGYPTVYEPWEQG